MTAENEPAPRTPMSSELVARRRAIEALRSGVPSRDAVAVLGSGQPEAEDRFAAAGAGGSAAIICGRAGCCWVAGSAAGRVTC